MKRHGLTADIGFGKELGRVILGFRASVWTCYCECAEKCEGRTNVWNITQARHAIKFINIQLYRLHYNSLNVVNLSCMSTRLTAEG